MIFTAQVIATLEAGLSRDFVKSRKQGNRDVSYVESWHCIREANRIFGFGGWSSETLDICCVSAKERMIGVTEKFAGYPGWGVSYTARVRVTVDHVTREGCGAGHGIDRDLGQAHESALKEAESDAQKRALRTFGNPFGLALYDRSQADVIDAPDETETSRQLFITKTKESIERLKDRWPDLFAWWTSSPQKQARRDFELSDPEVEELKNLVMSHRPQEKTDAES